MKLRKAVQLAGHSKLIQIPSVSVPGTMLSFQVRRFHDAETLFNCKTGRPVCMGCLDFVFRTDFTVVDVVIPNVKWKLVAAFPGHTGLAFEMGMNVLRRQANSLLITSDKVYRRMRTCRELKVNSFKNIEDRVPELMQALDHRVILKVTTRPDYPSNPKYVGIDNDNKSFTIYMREDI